MTQLESLAPLSTLLLSWLLRTSAILAIALVAMRLVERRSAALRHAVLTAGIVATLAVPLLSALGITTFIPTSVVEYPRGVAARLGVERQHEDPTLLPAGAPAPELALDPRSVQPVRQRDPQRIALGALAFIWLAGVTALLLRRTVAVVAADRVRRRARPVSDSSVLALVRRVAASQGVRHIPDLRVSDTLIAPATLGCLRPAILLPAAMLAWPAQRLYPVLAHELAHVARRDCLTTLLGDIANALYWCNPLVWLLTRRMTMERERACDDRALAAGVDPTQYGMLLLDVARSAYGAALPASVLMMARPRELESRLLAIMSNSVSDRAKVSRRSIIAIVVATALLGTAAAGHAASQTSRSRSLEPDRRGDSVAHPMSEITPIKVHGDSLADRVRKSALWTGPDSTLVRQLTGYLAHKPTSPVENGYARTVWLLLRARGDGIVDDLLVELGSRDWRGQSMAAWGLALAREPRAVPGLILQLEHEVWRVRAMAAWALYEIGDSSALPAVVRLLDDEAWQVRTPVVSYVAEHAKAADAMRLISPRLRDRHVAVRRAASMALDAIVERIR